MYTIRKAVIGDHTDLCKWDNDSYLRVHANPQPRGSFHLEPEPEEVALETIKSGEPEMFMIDYQGQSIGMFNVRMDPPMLLRKEPGTLWPGIIIGDHRHWGKGAAKLAMLEIERIAKERKVNRIELGVFSFNSRARTFYQKMDYKFVGVVPKIAFFRGEMWDDIRLEKRLSNVSILNRIQSH